MNKYNEMVRWNKVSYGNAIKIRRTAILSVFLALCIITPFTNWLIPFRKRIITKDLVWRYG